MDSSTDCFVGLGEEALAVGFGLALSCAALGGVWVGGPRADGIGAGLGFARRGQICARQQRGYRFIGREATPDGVRRHAESVLAREDDLHLRLSGKTLERVARLTGR